ncbi:MAG TPA: VWA domain-containing protein [Clostridia bacterium]|nr:VWA domain-containing protein [Clostridia bacterium]
MTVDTTVTAHTLAHFAEKLGKLLKRRAVRIGEASVASLHPHSFNPAEPWRVRVIKAQDAGMVFYGRKDAREVIHVDIFHEPGFVDHLKAAAALIDGFGTLGDELTAGDSTEEESCPRPRMSHWASLIRRQTPRPPAQSRLRPLDYVDIQTGTGGGRVTGRLTFGKGSDVRRAHMNHVHLALAWRPHGPLLTLCAVWFLEQEILRQGLNLRRIESIVRGSERIDRKALREEYGSDFDSFLSGEGADPEEGTAKKVQKDTGTVVAPNYRPGEHQVTFREDFGRTPSFGRTLSEEGHWARPGMTSKYGMRGIVGRWGGDTRGAFLSASDLSASESYHALHREGGDVCEFVTKLGIAMDAMEHFLSSRELKEALETLSPDRAYDKPKKGGLAHFEPQMEEALIRKGLARREGHRAVLTGQGRDLLLFLQRYWPEIDCEVRRVLRKLPPGVFRSWGLPAFHSKEWGKRRTGKGQAVSAQPGDWLGELAPVETVTRSLLRNLTEASSTSPFSEVPARTRVDFHLERSDLHEILYRTKETRDVCILLDASSSMAGRRIAAAKRLAAHLLLQGKNRASVIVFKDSSAEVKLPLTRCYRRAAEALSTIQASGLTPLAHGLKRASEYLSAQRCRKPVLVLITDGIPTVGLKNSPTQDAVEAAGRLKELGIHLVSIGLEPNRAFLEELSAKASGKLYVLGELEGTQLARVVHRECKV